MVIVMKHLSNPARRPYSRDHANKQQLTAKCCICWIPHRPHIRHRVKVNAGTDVRISIAAQMKWRQTTNAAVSNSTSIGVEGEGGREV